MTDANSNLVKKIKHQSLSTVIFSQLEEMILSRKILPGERINESKLSSALGVSRAPLREACRILERYGMVEVRTNRGTFVKEINLKEMEGLYDIRSVLDALAVEKACERISKKQIEELRGFLETMRNAKKKGDTQQYFKNNLKFHAKILHIADNANLMELCESISKKSSLFRGTSLAIPGRLEISLKQHEAIFDAIIAGDSTQAAQLMKCHIMDAKTALLASCTSSEER